MQRTETHFPSLAGVTDIVGALRFRADERPNAPACLLLENGERPLAPLHYAELLESARRIAGALRARTLIGARVMLAFPASADFVAALFGCFIAGVIAVPVPPPRGGRAGGRWEAVARDCDAALLLTTRAILEWLPVGGAVPAFAIEGLDGEAIDGARIDPDAIALLQYTSGSTGAPKGVIITHRAIWHNQSVIRTCFDHAEGVTLVGWLPNFHDMGLIGNLLQPIYAGGLSVILPPAAFMQKPMRWLHAVSRYRAHTSGAPNFAYDLCLQAATEANCEGLDLSSWRVAFNGAEPVRKRTLDAFAARFASSGFRREALMACYGLAESTLMVTGGRVEAGVGSFQASKAGLAAGVLAPGATEDAMACVSCGDEVAGASVRVADPFTGAPLCDGSVGEVLVRSESVCAGYWNKPAESRAAFRALKDGVYLRTGDLGARRDGQLYIVGRLKDLLILNGRNVHPADIEDAVLATFAGEGLSRAVAVGTAGARGEEALLFVEVSREALRRIDVDAFCAGLRRAALQIAEAPLAGIVLLKQGAAPLTSSGKVRRAACRDLYFTGQLPGLVVEDAGAARLRADAAPVPEALARTIGSA